MAVGRYGKVCSFYKGCSSWHFHKKQVIPFFNYHISEDLKKNYNTVESNSLIIQKNLSYDMSGD